MVKIKFFAVCGYAADIFMPKTKEQKIKEVGNIAELLKKANGFVVLGFSNLSVNKLNFLRRQIREKRGELKVVKRRLFAIALREAGVIFEPGKFLGQMAFIPFFDDLSGIASAIYEIEKEGTIEVFGGFDLKNKSLIEADYIKRIGHLPSKEVLLGQVVGAVSAPIRALVYILSQKAKVGS